MSDNEYTSHPSYGSIRLSRTQGGDGRLFMSPLRHDHRISITIGPAEHVRSLNTDTHYGKAQTYITIDLSEEQFARFVCGVGDGNGVPCTIRRLGQESVEAPPVQLAAERHYNEAKMTAKETLQALDDLLGSIDEVAAKSPQKVRDALKSKVQEARRKVGDHMPWIVQMLHEHMDKVVSSAKIEVEAYVNRRLSGEGLGLEAGEAAGRPALLLGSDEE